MLGSIIPYNHQPTEVLNNPQFTSARTEPISKNDPPLALKRFSTRTLSKSEPASITVSSCTATSNQVNPICIFINNVYIYYEYINIYIYILLGLSLAALALPRCMTNLAFLSVPSGLRFNSIGQSAPDCICTPVRLTKR